jgi:hypothetical protein
MVNSGRTSAAEVAPLLGPMIADIFVETGQAAIRLPGLPFNTAQGIIGCPVTNTLAPEIIHSFKQQQWPIFLAIVLIFIVEPLLVPTEPEKGFALLLLPDFELPVLPNLEMLSSLAHFLKPTFREEDCSPARKSCKHPTK